MTLRIIIPQLKRFWRERRTYKTQVFLGALSSLIGLLQFGLMGLFLRSGGTFPSLERYDNNILGFVLTGALGSSFLFLVMGSPKSAIQEEQRTGTLEMIMMSKGSLARVLLARLIITFISTTLTSSILVLVFAEIFDVKLEINLVGLALTIATGSVVMASIGWCAAGYILYSKAGEPFTWFITTVVGLFSGVLFPVEFYPEWIAKAAYFLPTTGVLTALRMVTLTDTKLNQVLAMLAPCFLWCLFLVPLGVLVYRWGMNKARLSGSIGSY